MMLSRRAAFGGLLAAPAILRAGRARAAAKTLKISHQFPGGTADEGDFRDRLVRRFAAEVEKKTGGELAFEIYPGSSLMKTVAQFSALRRGALDLSLYPLAYAGGEVQEVNIGLMPCLVSTYEQGMAWKNNEIGRELISVLDKRGVKIVTWIWQAGGCASRAGAVISPDDTKGMKVRGGSREMDLMLKAAGGIISSVPSNEIYAAMQTGTLDAAVTSSTSLISFRLQEIAKNVTGGRHGSFWFMLEPLLMSKSIHDGLTPDQQKAISEVGTGLEDFALQAARADDDALAEIYGKAGVKVSDFDAAALGKWKAIAEATAWKDFAARNAACASLLKLAEAVA
ncbi:TRAP transporter substrate-binding protein DctP [Limobrevibacterium gyesilva]|uniref:TRAP transporter substrate-binding protein DctP n=1 Tax=Limobrevibacterium gyesilva TaxID=2991712 RepID=A0AA42CGS3_9PROT|nr:TRAP transporter substrate-binding protein DctP [Limobrevibacterium gyesilva]MCW3474272.1 TRAP transporter substrate-binding protein DctP [Limobrevibacterium gyesilva]